MELGPMKRALLVLAAVIVVGLIAARALHVEQPDPVAPLRTDHMIETLRDEGWTVVTAEEYGEMKWSIADLETDTSTLRRKVRELLQAAQIAGAEVRAVTEMRAEAETALRLSGEAHSDTLMRLERQYADVPRVADSVTATFDDGVFSGRVAYFPRSTELGLLVGARIDAALAGTEGADGRVLFSAVPSDPRVRISLDRAQWSPPEPVRVCPIMHQARAGVVTVVGWEGAKLLYRAWQGR